MRFWVLTAMGILLASCASGPGDNAGAERLAAKRALRDLGVATAPLDDAVSEALCGTADCTLLIEELETGAPAPARAIPRIQLDRIRVRARQE